MQALIGWFTSEQGRRVTAWVLTAVASLMTAGKIPDVAVPGLGLSLSQMLGSAAVAVATTSGSSTRQ